MFIALTPIYFKSLSKNLSASKANGLYPIYGSSGWSKSHCASVSTVSSNGEFRVFYDESVNHSLYSSF
jgi:poly-D-alanine transfer protein DltD